MSDKFRSVLQRVLVWLVIVGLVLPPAPFFVGEARASGSEADATKLSQAENLALVGATKVPSKRTAKSRVFETSDGRGRAEVHSESIHYLDGQSAWQPINNNLTTASSPYAYQNTANRFTAKFKNTLASDYLYFQQGSDTISVSLLDATAGSAQTSNNTITYSGVRTGLDIRYTVGPDSLKSDFILKQEPANRTFTYAITVSSGLSMSATNGAIKVVKNNATIWELPRPSAINPIINEPVFTDYAIESTGSNSYEATFTIPDSFLPPPERGYPVTIDPSIVVVTGDALKKAPEHITRLGKDGLEKSIKTRNKNIAKHVEKLKDSRQESKKFLQKEISRMKKYNTYSKRIIRYKK